MRSAIGTLLCARGAARAGSTLAATLLTLGVCQNAFATGPTLPVQAVSATSLGPSKSAKLQVDATVDAAVSDSEVTISASVQSAGKRVAEKAAKHQPSAAATKAAAPNRFTGPALSVDELPDGVYAHVVEITSKTQGVDVPEKNIVVSTTEYFRIAGGKAAPIDSEEYTAEVQPIEEVTRGSGKSERQQRGTSVVDRAGPPKSGNTPLAKSLDDPPEADPAPTGPRN